MIIIIFYHNVLIKLNSEYYIRKHYLIINFMKKQKCEYHFPKNEIKE